MQSFAESKRAGTPETLRESNSLGWGKSLGLRSGKDDMNFQKKIFVKYVYAILKTAAELLYPPRCPVCDELLSPGKNAICISCEKKITRITELVCKKCGKPLSNERKEYCGDCARKHHSYRQGKAVFLYKGEMRQSLYRFKYSNRREYASFYAGEAVSQYASWVRRREIEVIVPIPMYTGKKRRRGYNQAEVFAKALGRKMDIPVETKLVKRTRDTIPQKELNDNERKKNLKNAFQVTTQKTQKNQKVQKNQYKQVLLVDDIYTTGSTMDAVAEVLLSSGAQNIYYICISIGQGN